MARSGTALIVSLPCRREADTADAAAAASLSAPRASDAVNAATAA